MYTNKGLHWDEAGFRPSETSTFPVHWKRGRSWHNLDRVPYQRLSVSTFTLTHFRLFLVLFQWFFFFAQLIHLLLENWVRNGLMSCSTSSPVRRCWPLKTAWHLWHGEPGEVRGLCGSLKPLIYRLSSHSSSDITYRNRRGEHLYDHSAGKKMNMWGTAVAIFHKLFLTKGAWLKHTLLEKCLGVVEAVNKKFHTHL